VSQLVLRQPYLLRLGSTCSLGSYSKIPHSYRHTCFRSPRSPTHSCEPAQWELAKIVLPLDHPVNVLSFDC
jgi:hypothetical protein